MRKRFAIILVLVFVGISSCLPGNVSMAEHNEDGYGDSKELGESDTELFQGELKADNAEVADSDSEMDDNDAPEAGLDSERGDSYSYSENSVSGGDAATAPYGEGTVSGGDAATAPYGEGTVSGGNAATMPYGEGTVSGGDAAMIPNAENSIRGDDVEIVSLQLPQQLDIVIDPWGMDKKGQIYSEQYIVRNTGKTTGTLILTNSICVPMEQGSVGVRKDSGGMHDDQEKSIYLEMKFGNGDKVIFSQEGSMYETQIAPGGELVFWFSGEVNENASQPWINGDVEVKVTYFWTVEDEIPDVVAAGEEKAVLGTDNGEIEESTLSGENYKTERIVSETESDKAEEAVLGEESSTPSGTENVEEEGKPQPDIGQETGKLPEGLENGIEESILEPHEAKDAVHIGETGG